VRGCEALFGPAPEIGRKIKTRVLQDTGLIASVGVAPNKFLAKLASDLGKPDGFVIVAPDKVRDTLALLPVGRVWGVGAKAERRCAAGSASWSKSSVSVCAGKAFVPRPLS